MENENIKKSEPIFLPLRVCITIFILATIWGIVSLFFYWLFNGGLWFWVLSAGVAIDAASTIWKNPME